MPCTIAELREYVFKRDHGCVAALAATEIEDFDHVCRDSFGERHRFTDLSKLQLAHVPAAGLNALGKRAIDDELHTVAECAAANVFPGPSAKLREFERRWIAAHEPGAKV